MHKAHEFKACVVRWAPRAFGGLPRRSRLGPWRLRGVVCCQSYPRTGFRNHQQSSLKTNTGGNIEVPLIVKWRHISLDFGPLTPPGGWYVLSSPSFNLDRFYCGNSGPFPWSNSRCTNNSSLLKFFNFDLNLFRSLNFDFDPFRFNFGLAWCLSWKGLQVCGEKDRLSPAGLITPYLSKMIAHWVVHSFREGFRLGLSKLIVPLSNLPHVCVYRNCLSPSKTHQAYTVCDFRSNPREE